jgi:hypothetical protein
MASGCRTESTPCIGGAFETVVSRKGKFTPASAGIAPLVFSGMRVFGNVVLEPEKG